jgi:hypothetical protein
MEKNRSASMNNFKKRLMKLLRNKGGGEEEAEAFC